MLENEERRKRVKLQGMPLTPKIQPGDLVSGLGLAPVSDLIRVLMVSYNI